MNAKTEEAALTAARAEEVYERLYRQEYERDRNGQFVVIDVDSEKAYVSDTPESAFQLAIEDSPSGDFFLLRVGAPAAFRTSYVGQVA